MANKSLSLNTIAYIKSEIGEDSAFAEWCNFICDNEPKIQIVASTSMFEVYTSECTSDMLLITNSNETIKLAKSYGIACVGYIPNRDRFLRCSYVIEGFDEVDIDYLNKIYLRFHNIPWTITATDRCIIRELTLEDMDALFDLYSKPGMTKYVEPLFDYEEELEYERKYIENMYGYFGYGMWLVFSKESGELIGRAGLEHRDYNGDGDELELGYMIAPEYQNMGYATEICTAIIKYAKDNLDFNRINCLIDDDNIPSIRLATKLGFKHVGSSTASGTNMEHFVLSL